MKQAQTLYVSLGFQADLRRIDSTPLSQGLLSLELDLR